MGKRENDERKRTVNLNAILSMALLFLSVIMIKTAFTQFFTDHIVSGCINAVGGLLFFGVSMTLLRDLCKYLQKKEPTQEDTTDGC